jgi:hypothetical protein
MKLRLIAAIFAVLLCAAGAEAQQTWNNVRVNLHIGFGGTDNNFPGCGGRMLGAYGGSLQLGTPIFAEFGAESFGTGGNDCLPITPPTTPGGDWGELNTPDTGGRFSLGVGRHFLRDHLNAKVRGGMFGDIGPFASAYVGARVWIFTTGFEFGHVNAEWTFSNGVAYRKWSKFGNWQFGVRF